MKEALDYSESNLAQAQAVSDITPTDCICSLLWIYITRARHLASHMPNEEKSVFTTTVDMRNFFDRGVGLASHFGNLFMTVSREEHLDNILSVVEERGKQYLDSEFLENIISRAYGQRGRLGSWVNEERFLERMSALSNVKPPSEVPTAARRACRPWAYGINFSSLVDHGADTNFGIPGTGGDGTPRFCRVPWVRETGTVYTLPRKGKRSEDGDWEILVCLPDHVMKRLLAEKELGQFIDRYVHDANIQDRWRRRTNRARTLSFPDETINVHTSMGGLTL
ncbi:hypothetical protein BJ166DRAFT_341978 [Pestalotiopsis sp. NC0098]|nr:hypothetical protein BJ166DRAFT_341978 [Pestalotiopsis sp. NC0098]